MMACGRAEPSQRKTTGHDVNSALRQRLLRRYGQNARPRRSAMLHARHDLLPHIAALLEVHAMKKIEAGLMREGIAVGVILSNLRDGKPDAHGVIIAWACRELWRIGFAKEHPEPQQWKTWVWVSQRRVCLRPLGRAVAPGSSNPPVLRHIRNCDLGAQPVKREALCKVGADGAGAIDEKGFAGRHDEKIEKNLALRRQKTGKAHLAFAQPFRIIGDEALKEGCAILACDFQNVSIRDKCCVGGHRPRLLSG